MGILICLLGFALAFGVGRRSIGAGLCVVLTVGYAYGMIRAHEPDPSAYFVFDATVLGFYAGFLQRVEVRAKVLRGRAALVWTALLIAWPLLLLVLPDASFLVRMVGLRAAVLLLPMVAIGARATPGDLRRVGVWLLFLNVGAFVVGVLEYSFGLDAFIPRVAATELIYRSNDVRVGGEVYHRIPSIFTSSHAFGGTMVASLPLLVLALVARRRAVRPGRWLIGGAAVVATLLGVFLCGARQPVVVLGLVAVLSALRGGLRRQSLWVVFLAGLVVTLVVGEAARLQRFLNLVDTDATLTRVSLSVNESFLDLLGEQPFGRGLGSAIGTSMPGFLKDEMPVQVGLESEYSRLLVEQGLIGLLFWVAFIVWLAAKRIYAPSREAWPSVIAMQGLLVATWVSALIGTGTLTSVPQSVLVLLQMGVVAGGRWPSSDSKDESSVELAHPIVERGPPVGWMPVPRADRATSGRPLDDSSS